MTIQKLFIRVGMLCVVFGLFAVWTLTAQDSAPVTTAEGALAVCPAQGLQARPRDLPLNGRVITTFDRASLWVYNMANGSRFPLEIRPCRTNCRLSPDGEWFTVYNATDRTFDKIRLDGANRTVIADRVTDVEWWGDGNLVVWSSSYRAFLQAEGAESERQPLSYSGVTSIQPFGKWALKIQYRNGEFLRSLTDLENPQAQTFIGLDMPYFNASSWSPDGAWFAYVLPTLKDGVPHAELFTVQPRGSFPTQITRFAQSLGAVRIGGQSWSNSLAWSPDGTRLLFWVTPLHLDENGDPLPETGDAVLYMYNQTENTLTHFCGYTTQEHTPNTPRLAWSPDGRFVAFGADDPNSTRGNLLIALDTQTGNFYEISSGIYPALGKADVIAWGN